MATKKEFAKGKTIYVAIPSKFTFEQTQEVTKQILGHTGCPFCHSGVNFNFIDEVELISAGLNERGEIQIG